MPGRATVGPLVRLLTSASIRLQDSRVPDQKHHKTQKSASAVWALEKPARSATPPPSKRNQAPGRSGLFRGWGGGNGRARSVLQYETQGVLRKMMGRLEGRT